MKSLLVFGGFSAFIVFVWVDYPFALARWLGPTATMTDRGLYGDSFGALNTLFSGIALVGVAINIYLQNAQIRKLEKKEDETEGHLKKQVEVMRQTALLQYYNELISQIEQQVFELELQHQAEERRLRGGQFSQFPAETGLVVAARLMNQEGEVRELVQIEARLRIRKAELDKQKDRRRAILVQLNAED